MFGFLQAAKSCNCWNSAGESFSHVRLLFVVEDGGEAIWPFPFPVCDEVIALVTSADPAAATPVMLAQAQAPALELVAAVFHNHRNSQTFHHFFHLKHSLTSSSPFRGHPASTTRSAMLKRIYDQLCPSSTS